MNDELEVYLMTDQPPECPKCGRRVDIIAGITTDRQVARCETCDFNYRLESDED